MLEKLIELVDVGVEWSALDSIAACQAWKIGFSTNQDVSESGFTPAEINAAWMKSGEGSLALTGLTIVRLWPWGRGR